VKWLKKILVVEDDIGMQKSFGFAFDDEVDIIFATSTTTAREALSQNPDICLIGMDGVLDDTDFPDFSSELVREIRAKGFKGPMIAISGADEAQEKLVEAGCDCCCRKPEFPKKASEILGLNNND